MRWLPLSATNTSFAAASTATAAGRFSVVWLSGPSILPGVPICSRNLPSRENLRTCASGGPAAVRRAAPAAGEPRPARSPTTASPRPRAACTAAWRFEPGGGNPDVALRVHGEAARRLRPLVALSRPAQFETSLPSDRTPAPTARPRSRRWTIGGLSIIPFSLVSSDRRRDGRPRRDSGHRRSTPVTEPSTQ